MVTWGADDLNPVCVCCFADGEIIKVVHQNAQGSLHQELSPNSPQAVTNICKVVLSIHAPHAPD